MVTKGAALLLAAFGFVNLWIAVLVDVGTSLIVILNGLQLARVANQSQDELPDDLIESKGSGAEHAQNHLSKAAD
jgi:hypothetical protein